MSYLSEESETEQQENISLVLLSGDKFAVEICSEKKERYFLSVTTKKILLYPAPQKNPKIDFTFPTMN